VAAHKRLAAALNAWILFQDEAGQSLRPPKARTWSPRGTTPKVVVSGRNTGRVNLAGLIAVRPGCRTRLIYHTIVHHGRRAEKKGFTQRDLIKMLDLAHQVLGRAPIILVWDNEVRHRAQITARLVAARDWLTVFRLPSYTPALNPVEGLWSHLKRSIANLAPRGIDELAALVKTRLRRMQYRTDGLLDGFIAQTGLTLEPP
jgi:putative transposase